MRCVFSQQMTISGAHLKWVSLSGCRIPGIEGYHCRTQGSLSLDADFGKLSVCLRGSVIGGSLHCRKATFNGGLDCSNTRIGGDIDCRGTEFNGGMDCRGAMVAGDLDCSGAKFNHKGEAVDSASNHHVEPGIGRAIDA